MYCKLAAMQERNGREEVVREKERENGRVRVRGREMGRGGREASWEPDCSKLVKYRAATAGERTLLMSGATARTGQCSVPGSLRAVLRS